MSSNLVTKKITSTIGFRIAGGYSLLVLLSVFGLMIIAYLFLGSTLASQDRDQVTVELQSLRAQYLEGGLDSFTETIREREGFRKKNPFFFRVHDPEGKTVTIFFPQHWQEFDLGALERMAPAPAGTWTLLPARDGAWRLEILNERLPDDFQFQVGISSDDREAVLESLEKTFLFAIFPMLVLGLAGGAILAQRALRPARHLIRTVESINNGRLEARAPRTYNGDELDELGRMFNGMTDRIRSLIQGMKHALDAVAHDLRTPMTRFRNKAENALREGGMQNCREALQACIEESDHILRLLNTLMDISEAETGTLHLNRSNVDFSALLGNLAEMYCYVAEEKGVEVKATIPQQIRATIDPERMSQAVANLLDNAVKYTPAGGRVELILTANPGRLCLRVLDTGVGIDPADLGRIWDRLYRGCHDNTKGIGLGLSLVQAITKAHGGNISARNRSAGGAMFEMIFPATS